MSAGLSWSCAGLSWSIAGPKLVLSRSLRPAHDQLKPAAMVQNIPNQHMLHMSCLSIILHAYTGLRGALGNVSLTSLFAHITIR